VGSAFSHVSRLNHTACSLAVYASQLGLLRSNTTQDSLPAGGQPWRGRTLTCWVASGGFHSVLQLTSFPPPRSFTWRTSQRDAVHLAFHRPANGPRVSSRAKLGRGFPRWGYGWVGKLSVRSLLRVGDVCMFRD